MQGRGGAGPRPAGRTAGAAASALRRLDWVLAGPAVAGAVADRRAAGLVGDPAAAGRGRRRPRRVPQAAPAQPGHRAGARRGVRAGRLPGAAGVRAADLRRVLRRAGRGARRSARRSTARTRGSCSAAGSRSSRREFAKVALVVGMAVLLAERRTQERAARRPDVPLVLALAAVPLGLVMLQPDLGTAMVFVFTVLGVLLLAGAPARWLGRPGAGGACSSSTAAMQLGRAQGVPAGAVQGVHQPGPGHARGRVQHHRRRGSRSATAG